MAVTSDHGQFLMATQPAGGQGLAETGALTMETGLCLSRRWRERPVNTIAGESLLCTAIDLSWLISVSVVSAPYFSDNRTLTAEPHLIATKILAFPLKSSRNKNDSDLLIVIP